jgi:hypothetical protein
MPAIQIQDQDEESGVMMAIHHYMIHLSVNTSGDEKMYDAIRDRMAELSTADDSTLSARLGIFEGV